MKRLVELILEPIAKLDFYFAYKILSVRYGGMVGSTGTESTDYETYGEVCEQFYGFLPLLGWRGYQ